MEHPGLLSWANSIRLTMANDPGRQFFKEQVQTHGFLFLDDYLDNIISGAKQDPLIDLVKTPGRKKAIARKPKLMSSKLANTVSVTLEESASVENLFFAPNPFAAALEKVSNLEVETGAWILEKNKPEPTPPIAEKGSRPPLASIQPHNDASDASATVSEQYVSFVPPPVEPPALDSIHHQNMEHNDLSVIAEDDESPERSHAFISGHRESTSNLFLPNPDTREESIPVPIPRLSTLAQTVSQDELTTTSRSSTSTLHSIALNSFGDQQDEILPSQLDIAISAGPEARVVEEDTGPIPPQSPMDTQRYATTELHENASPVSLKPSEKPSFPILPEPMPLRKSMRPTREASLNNAMIGSSTPGAALGGKRTSWLMKAREVKALEAPPKKPHIPPFNLNIGPSFSLPQGTKRKSADMLTISDASLENEERQPKALKTTEGATASRNSKDLQPESKQEKESTAIVISQEVPMPGDISQEGVLDRLKKTVEGFGARVSKTMGKSVGGGTATALAEARAAAEARVAERDRKEVEMTMAMGVPAAKSSGTEPSADTDIVMAPTRPNEGRLSISDLFPAEGRVKEKHKIQDKPFQFTPSFTPTKNKQTEETVTARESTSTTPPHSPPQKSVKAISYAPVFKQPPPVFVPPAPAPDRIPASTTQHPSIFSAPPAASINTLLPPVEQTGVPLTAQSTLESVQSDDIFDRDTVPAWLPSTQDTEYTSYDSQSQPQSTQICDEDDSWPMDEKLAAGVQWTFGASKEDSMTWSTLPSQSQRADTGPIAKASSNQEEASGMEVERTSRQIPGAFGMDVDHATEEEEPLDRRDVELENLILGSSSKAVVSSAEPKPIVRSQSQMSMASSESSQSQVGFLGQASKLLSSALGNKKKPEVKKVLQMAAVAAKKQQEESDKKAARLKDMESRRQLAIQRKAEEEKSKTLEEERKMKEEAERRKREREDLTDKRALKPPGSKKEEDTQKKRKVDSEKKQEIKKPGPSVLVGKSHLKSALKQSSTSNSSHAFGASNSMAVAESSTSLYKGKAPTVQQPVLDDEVAQPSLLVQSQMAARAQAQIDASKHIEPPVASESIELPDINSEYSDSEDEDRVRTFDPPEWAQSPELRQALEMQRTINPDDIFGAVRPLKMEEIFKTRTSRFRARSSSANWTGTDRLTMQEERDYARRMGFK